MVISGVFLVISGDLMVILWCFSDDFPVAHWKSRPDMQDWKSSKGSSKGYHKGTPSWSYAESKVRQEVSSWSIDFRIFTDGFHEKQIDPLYIYISMDGNFHQWRYPHSWLDGFCERENPTVRNG